MWQKTFGGSILLASLCGCAIGRLPAQFPLNSVTSLKDKNGGDFLKAQSISDEVGLHLRPGDVIYLRRWSAGVAKPLQAATLNRTTPPAFIDRIPLRHVKDPNTRLYDYEREFLINTLSLNRSKNFKDSDKIDELTGELLRNEAALWNALVDNLWIKRFGKDLILTVRLTAVTEKLPSLYSSLFMVESNEPGRRDREITAIETPLSSPYRGLLEATPINSSYANKENPAAHALFNFLAVELSGTEMSTPGPQEQDWTLDDWENSDICQAQTSTGDVPAKIRTIWPINYAGAIRVTSSTPTRKVVLDLQHRSRSLERQPDSSWRQPSIAREDLGRLTLRDIKALEWSANDKGVDLYHVVPNCRVRQGRLP